MAGLKFGDESSVKSADEESKSVDSQTPASARMNGEEGEEGNSKSSQNLMRGEGELRETASERRAMRVESLKQADEERKELIMQRMKKKEEAFKRREANYRKT